MKKSELTTETHADAKPVLPVVYSQSWRKCYHCGKFLSYKQLQEQTEVMHVYIPDTEHTQEQSYWVHKYCW